MPLKPIRTFTADEGDYSIGIAGPDQIEHDIDELCKKFDPLSTMSDGVPGGISGDNIQEDAIKAAHLDPSIAGEVGGVALAAHADSGVVGIHNSASEATVSTLMHRDVNGNSKVAVPTEAAHVARLDSITKTQAGLSNVDNIQQASLVQYQSLQTRFVMEY